MTIALAVCEVAARISSDFRVESLSRQTWCGGIELPVIAVDKRREEIIVIHRITLIGLILTLTIPSVAAYGQQVVDLRAPVAGCASAKAFLRSLGAYGGGNAITNMDCGTAIIAARNRGWKSPEDLQREREQRELERQYQEHQRQLELERQRRDREFQLEQQRREREWQLDRQRSEREHQARLAQQQSLLEQSMKTSEQIGDNIKQSLQSHHGPFGGIKLANDNAKAAIPLGGWGRDLINNTVSQGVGTYLNQHHGVANYTNHDYGHGVNAFGTAGHGGSRPIIRNGWMQPDQQHHTPVRGVVGEDSHYPGWWDQELAHSVLGGLGAVPNQNAQHHGINQSLPTVQPSLTRSVRSAPLHLPQPTYESQQAARQREQAEAQARRQREEVARREAAQRAQAAREAAQRAQAEREATERRRVDGALSGWLDSQISDTNPNLFSPAVGPGFNGAQPPRFRDNEQSGLGLNRFDRPARNVGRFDQAPNRLDRFDTKPSRD